MKHITFLVRTLTCSLALLVSQLRAADTTNSAPTRMVEVGNIRFAYRTIGINSEVPLVLFNHSRGTLDSWDPAFVDALGKTRSVILFDNAGVGGSTGTTPDNFAAMASDAISFIRALKLEQIDILGFSIGGCVAQEVALQAPELVRRVVLAATAPKGGEDIRLTGQAREIFLHPRSGEEAMLYLFFSPSATSQAAGRRFLGRRDLRKDRVPNATVECGRAQLAAREAWGESNPAYYGRLVAIQKPVLVANGNKDIMMHTRNSLILEQNLPNATLIVYPDSGHGFLFQYPEKFAEDVARFLSQ